MRVSVLIPHFNREDVLERSLWSLLRQTHKDYEIWIIDDGSFEAKVLLHHEPPLLNCIQVRSPAGTPRPPNIALWEAYEKCSGEFIIVADPEMLAPLDAIALMVEEYRGNRLVAPAYHIHEKAQTIIDTVPWQSDLSEIQSLPDFWAVASPWGRTNRGAKGWCSHLSFTGQTREEWDRTNFLPKNEEFAAEAWLHGEEKKLKRPAKCASYFVYHQHHKRYRKFPPFDLEIWRDKPEHHEEPSASVRIKRIRKANLRD